MKKSAKIKIRWRKEGSGYVGRWETPDTGEEGPYKDLIVEPEGGLHGQWLYSVKYGGTLAAGTVEDSQQGKKRAGAVFRALVLAIGEG